MILTVRLLLTFFLLVVACSVGYAADSSKSSAPAADVDSGKASASAVRQGPSGKQLFMVCEGCHSLQRGSAHKVGPNLFGIIGQPAASRAAYDYSPALQKSPIVWSRNALIAFIWFTEGMAPGTWMIYHNHLSASEVERLVDYIESQSD